MPLEDFFSDMVELGGSGKRWRSPWAIAGLVIGIGLGAWLAVTQGEGGFLGVLGGAATGGFLGWAAALFLRGFGVFLLIFIVILAVTLGWQWLTG